MKDKLLFTGVFLLLLCIGFLTGRLSIKMEYVEDQTPLQDVGQISSVIPTINFTAFQGGILYGKTNGENVRIFVNDQILEERKEHSFFIDTLSIKESLISGNQEKYLYVASKSGEKYHLIGSSDANRISASNKVYFMTKEDAQKAGYEAGRSVK